VTPAPSSAPAARTRPSPALSSPPAAQSPGAAPSAPSSPAQAAEPPAARLSASASALAPGADVSISYSTAAVHGQAWIGVDVPGQPPGGVVAPCTRAAPGASGSVTCDTGSLDGPGQYEIYYGYGFGSGYHQLAGPVPLTVTGARSTLSASASTVARGASAQFSYTTPHPNYNNWVGIYPYGELASGGQWRSYQYAVGASGSVAIGTGSLSPGKYYVYLSYDDSYRVLTGPLTLTVTG
jgi:hypothetical protein